MDDHRRQQGAIAPGADNGLGENLPSEKGLKRLMPKDNKNRQEPAAFQVWHPDGTPYSDDDYRKAGMPVPTLEQLAHWAEMDRRFADLDTD